MAALSNRYNPYTGQETPDYTWAKNAAGTYVATFSPYFDTTNLVRQPQWPHTWTQDYAFQYDLAGAYRFGNVSSTTVAGAAWENTLVFSRMKVGPNLPAFNLYNQVYGALPVWNTLRTLSSAKSGTWQYYANERLGFFDDRLYLTGGGVRVSADRYNSNLLTNQFTALNDAKNLLMLGALAKPAKNISVYGSYSNNAIPTIANNKPLWQEGRQFEFGVKVTMLNERLSFTAAHFQIAQTNITVPNPEYVTDPTAPQSLVSDIKNHGYEFELMGGVTKDLSVIASLTYLRERDSLGRPVRAIAGQNAALFLNYHIPDPRLHSLAIFAGATYVGRRSGEAPAPDFTPLGVPTQPSFFFAPLILVSAGAKFDWTKRIHSTLNVDNALDEHYLIPTARANNTMGDPTNVRLTTTLQF